MSDQEATQQFRGDPRGFQVNQIGNPTWQLPAEQGKALENIVRNNPGLAKDPTAVRVLAEQYHVNSGAVANAIHAINASNAMAHSAWSWTDPLKALWGIPVGLGRGIRGLANQMFIQPLTHPQPLTWQGSNLGKIVAGARQELPYIPGQLESMATLAQSLRFPFQRNAQGQMGYQRDWETLKGLPLAPAHVGAAFATSVNQHGLMWTIGNHAFDFLLGAVTGGGASSLIGPEGAAGVEAMAARQTLLDKELLKNADQLIKDNPHDYQLHVDIKAAQNRLLIQDPAFLRDLFMKSKAWNPMTEVDTRLFEQAQARAAEAEAKAAETEAAVKEGGRFSKSANVAKQLSEWFNTAAVAMPLRAVRGAVKPLGGYGAQGFYLSYMQNALSNPMSAKIWDETADLNARDANGHIVSLGSQVAEMLGQQPGSVMFDATAYATDLMAQLGINDPLSKTFETFKMGRSFYGFTGKLGRWYGGLGIREPGDITRAYYQYSSVRRAVDLLAKMKSPSKILERFRGTFSDAVVGKLAKASTPQEVLSVLEDITEGLNIVSGMAPRLGWYSAAKVALTGKLGEKFGTLGNMVASDEIITKEMVAEAEKAGYDVSTKNLVLGTEDAAEKIKVMWRQRLALLARRAPMWRLGKTMSNRIVEPGSVESIPGLMDWARSLYMPEDVVRSIGDGLYIATERGDLEAYSRVFRRLVYEGIMRQAGAHYKYAELSAALHAVSDEVWKRVDQITGHDGGGQVGHYVRSSDDVDNEVLKEDGSVKRAGIGVDQLGKLILPRRTDAMRFGKAIGRDLNKMTRTGIYDSFLKTDTAFKTLVEAADRAGFSPEKIISHLTSALANTLEKDLADARPNVSKGFDTQAKMTMRQVKRLLNSETYKGLTYSEKIARITQYLEKKSETLFKQYSEAKQAIEEGLPLTDPAMKRAPFPNYEQLKREIQGQNLSVAQWQNNQAMEFLLGEHMAVQQMHGEIKAIISSTFDNLDAIDEQANLIAAMSAASKEAAEKFRKDFVTKWNTRNEAGAWKLGWLLGKRGARTNWQIIQDMNMAYLDKYFKPMSLSSVGWAERVSLSEVMLNALRQGPFHFFEAYLAKSYADKTLELEELAGKFDKIKAVAAEKKTSVTMLERQKFLLKNVVGGIVLGFDEALIKTFDSPRLERLLQDTIDIVQMNDGDLPWGSHAQHDATTSEAVEDAVLSQVWGLGKDGNLEASRMVRSDKHISIQNDNSAAGTAFFENISRTHHDPLLSQVAQYAHELISRRGAEYYSGEAGRARLLADLYPKALEVIDGLPENVVRRFERHTMRSAAYPDLSPHEGWAKVVAKDIANLGTGERGWVVYPEIFKQAATGEIESPRNLARWLSDKIKENGAAAVPSNFITKEFISPLSKGARSSLLIRASDRLHSSILGPIVNNLSRSPLFVLEYHNAMERLRPLVESKYLTLDQAMVQAQTSATIDMAKFVHNPLDKTMYEQNMRVLAPYYFAKNQSIRRAIRMAGDNPGAIVKYMKINLAFTNYIAEINEGVQNGRFHVPGGEMGTAVAGSFLNWLTFIEGGSIKSELGAQLGLDANPSSSLANVFITGTHAGWQGALENLLQIPWGPAVTIPAKFFYEYASNHNPHVYSLLKRIMPEAMNSSFLQELVPNTFVRGASEAAIGFTMGNTFTNSFTSVNHYVVNGMADELYGKFYDEAVKAHPEWVSGPMARSGAGEAMLQRYVAVKWGEYFSNPRNAQLFQDQANNKTAMMFALKLAGTEFLPFSVNIAQRFSQSDDITKIMQEKDADGNLKFPTYFLAYDEYTRTHPHGEFDLVPHTKSIFSAYPETKEMYEALTKHPEAVRLYPYAMAFAFNQGKYVNDPRAYQPELNLQLRKRATDKEYFDAIQIRMGGIMYNAVESQLLQQRRYIDPKTGGLNYEGIYQLNRQMKSYGQIYNMTWLADHNGGRRNNAAYNAYNELKQAIVDPRVESSFPAGSKEFFNEAIQVREAYNKEFKSLVDANKPTSQLKSKWYNFWEKINSQPEYEKYSTFIMSVMLKLPDPQ